ncbi:MAG: hypothetical protein DWG76_04170, partial [Chloroflexi bacterium]|nr:hypothetical protein [Chloroflexota bacterium]
LLLAACTRSSLSQGEGYFIAPSVDPNSTPLVLETATALPATPTPPCDNHMVFLQDLTIPDGTVMAARNRFEKVWQVRNDGSCPWTRGYTLKLEDGPSLGVLTRYPLPASSQGDTVELVVEFTAPDEAGVYRSSWRAHDFGGEPFGVLIYLEIVVQ